METISLPKFEVVGWYITKDDDKDFHKKQIIAKDQSEAIRLFEKFHKKCYKIEVKRVRE